MHVDGRTAQKVIIFRCRWLAMNGQISSGGEGGNCEIEVARKLQDN